MMEDNRLHIYCRKCLELAVIAKYGADEWYVHTEALVEQLNEFLQKHSITCPSEGGLDMFALRTEGDNDEFIADYSGQQARLTRKEAAHGTDDT